MELAGDVEEIVEALRETGLPLEEEAAGRSSKDQVGSALVALSAAMLSSLAGASRLLVVLTLRPSEWM